MSTAVDKLWLGAATEMPDGTPGFRVSLQVPDGIANLTRRERRQALEERFRELASEAVDPLGGRVDLGTVSVAAQTAEAILPSAGLEAAVAALRRRHVRVDPVVMRQVAPPF